MLSNLANELTDCAALHYIIAIKHETGGATTSYYGAAEQTKALGFSMLEVAGRIGAKLGQTPETSAEHFDAALKRIGDELDRDRARAREVSASLCGSLQKHGNPTYTKSL